MTQGEGDPTSERCAEWELGGGGILPRQAIPDSLGYLAVLDMVVSVGPVTSLVLWENAHIYLNQRECKRWTQWLQLW